MPLVSPASRRRGATAEDEEQGAGLPALRGAEQAAVEVPKRAKAGASPFGDSGESPDPARIADQAILDTIQDTILATGLRVAPGAPAPEGPVETSAARQVLEGALAERGKGKTEQRAAGGVVAPAPGFATLGQAEITPADATPVESPIGVGTAPPGVPQTGGAPAAAPSEARLAPLDVVRDSSRIAGETADGKVRVTPVGTPDRGEVAFAVRLQPMATQPMATQPMATQPMATQPMATQPMETQAMATQAMATQVKTARLESAARTTAGETQKTTGTAPGPQEEPVVTGKVPATGEVVLAATAGHGRRQAGDDQPYWSEQAGNAHAEGVTGVPAGKMAPPGAEPGDSRPERPAGQTASLDAGPARLEDAAKVEPKPEIHPASAREIKLEVTSGERRVEVRLTDRGGELRVAVRTPDNNLAGTLRENLPQLATRLAETGLRTQAWHPEGFSAGEWRHMAATAPGGLTQDADAQSRGQGRGAHGNGAQGDAQERHSKDVQEQQQHHKEKGKDFAWLMSSLR